jgi:lipopolysaccharide biosynthesis protein
MTFSFSDFTKGQFLKIVERIRFTSRSHYCGSREIEKSGFLEKLIIESLFMSALGRRPDREGILYWTQELRAGQPFDQLVSKIVHSTEFIALHGNSNTADSKFLTTLYRNALGREPDPDGLKYWATKQLSRDEAVRAFSTSKEALDRVQASTDVDCTVRAAQAFYKVAFNHEPPDSVKEDWNRKLNAGFSYEELARELIDSLEFQNLHGSESKVRVEVAKGLTATLLPNADEVLVAREQDQVGHIAVVLHLHYTDVWPEFAQAIRLLPEPADLYVTLHGHNLKLEDGIKSEFPHAKIFRFENRGRDVLPFVALINSGLLFGYNLICKLHTKKSTYRNDGDAWRKALVSGILRDRDSIGAILDAFRKSPDLGIVVADGQIFGQDPSHWVGNIPGIKRFGDRIGLSSVPEGALFPGGSMYWIRPFLLRQLAALPLTTEEFEPEPIPRDGTTAHVVERLIGMICFDAGMQLKEVSSLVNAPRTVAAKSRPRIVAFYLPQYHPIPENDLWWGKGFTEWTNVTKALPLFAGHRQPRLPTELGFYDLRLPETRWAQADLAREYGIDAFCYYYYWFDGRKLLDRPLTEMLTTKKPNFPFLICWANEPWTRNWDGFTKEVLMDQQYPTGWEEEFADDITPLLQDPRYFQIGSKPLLLVYRPQHLPDPKLGLTLLREVLQTRIGKDVYIMVGAFSMAGDKAIPDDPASLGADAYFDFPPHGFKFEDASSYFGKDSSFQGGVCSYDSAISSALKKLLDQTDFDRFPGLTMGWDNTARKHNRGFVLQGATPAKLRRWLRSVYKSESLKKGERLIFINAWNEWAEGTYLEPDRDFGRGWLEAVQLSISPP